MPVIELRAKPGKGASPWSEVDIRDLNRVLRGLQLDIDTLNGSGSGSVTQIIQNTQTIAQPSVLTYNIAGAVNDFAVGVDTTVLRFVPTSAAAMSVSGLEQGVDGKELLIWHAGTLGGSTVVLLQQSVLSVSANRFLNQGGGNITLTRGFGAKAWYDQTTGGWRVAAF